LVAGLRIFLSFHSKDQALAEGLRAGLKRLEPPADVFLSSVSLGAGFWLPKLAEEIAAADAFLLLIGRRRPMAATRIRRSARPPCA